MQKFNFPSIRNGCQRYVENVQEKILSANISHTPFFYFLLLSMFAPQNKNNINNNTKYKINKIFRIHERENRRQTIL